MMNEFKRVVFAVVAAMGVTGIAGEYRIVPSGYQEVEYIESTGAQTVDLGIVPGTDTDVEMDFRILDNSGEPMFFGQGWQGNGYMLCVSSGNFMFFGNSNPHGSGTQGVDFHLTVVDATMTIAKDGTPISGTPTTVITDASNNKNLILFGTSGHMAKMRFYSMKIWKGKELVRDLVPCYETADGGRDGLWDFASGTFLPNASSTAFNRGEAVDRRNVAVVTATPGEVGTPTPAYGLQDLVDGEEYSFEMPEVRVESQGDVYSLIGWELADYDLATGKFVKTRDSESGLAAGESKTCCKYTHAVGGLVRLTWKWQVVRALGIAEGSAVATSRNGFSVAAEVTGLGEGVPSATAFVAWGLSPSRLTQTNELETVTLPSSVHGTVSSGVMPGQTHYAKVFVVADEAVAEDPAGVFAFDIPTTRTSELPGDYQRLEYIASTGRQLIKTGVDAGKDLEVTCSFIPVGSCFNKALFGAAWGANDYLFCETTSGSFNFYGGGGVVAPRYDYSRYDLSVVGDTMRVSIDGKEPIEKPVDRTSSGELAIFGIPSGGNKSTYRLCSFSMTKAGELKRDFVAASNRLTGVVGLYDKVSGNLFPDEGGTAFVGGPALSAPQSRLTVTASPDEMSVVSPGYGTYEDLQPGDAFTCFGGAAVKAETSSAACTGWKVYTNAADNADVWLLAAEGDGAVCPYVHPAGSAAKLEWQWSAQYRVAVTAGEGGTAGFADGGENPRDLDFGETYEIVATPNEGWSFVGWTGDVPAAQSGENPLLLKPTQSGEVRAQFLEGSVATWTGGTEGGLASVPANWVGGNLPKDGDIVLLSGAGESHPLVWDLKSVTLGGWQQREAFTNTVTIATTFDPEDWPEFEIAGDVVLEGGAWTHLENPAPVRKGDAKYRMKVRIGGNLTVGPKAKITADSKGLPTGTGLGDTTSGGHGATYGGRGSGNNAVCYGSVKHPCDVGAGAYFQAPSAVTRGGGCVMLTVDGIARIDGAVSASADFSTAQSDFSQAYAQSGGTVAITAATITGDGAVCADASRMYCTQWGYNNGCQPAGGGRISLIQTAANATYDSLPANVTAYGSFCIKNTGFEVVMQQPDATKSGAGTIYYEVPSDQGRGKLIVKNPFDIGFNDMTYVTEFTSVMDQDLDFGEIEIGPGATIRVTEGCGMTNFANTVISGAGHFIVDNDLKLAATAVWEGVRLYPQNGAAIWGAESTTFDGAIAYLTGVSEAPCAVALVNGAKLTTLRTTSAKQAVDDSWRVDLHVAGDLTVDATSAITADFCGYASMTGPNFGPDGGRDAYGMYFSASHGGQGFNAAWTGAYPPAYGSVLQPFENGSGSSVDAADVPGGGRVKLVVDGKVRLNGVISANGSSYNNSSHCSGAGGSVWLTAAELEGDGVIQANGGPVYMDGVGGAGGRVAVVLTKKGATFADCGVVATAYPFFLSGHATASHCGTVYWQTGDESFGEGTLVIANDPNAQGSHLNVPATPIPMEEAVLLKKAKLVIGPYAGAIIPVDMKVKDLTMTAESSMLDLGGHVLSVGSPWHAYPMQGVINAGEWIDGKKPGYANIKWRTPGMAIMIR